MLSTLRHLLTEHSMWYDVDSFHNLTTITLIKMAADNVYFRQESVTETLI